MVLFFLESGILWMHGGYRGAVLRVFPPKVVHHISQTYKKPCTGLPLKAIAKVVPKPGGAGGAGLVARWWHEPVPIAPIIFGAKRLEASRAKAAFSAPSFWFLSKQAFAEIAQAFGELLAQTGARYPRAGFCGTWGVTGAKASCGQRGREGVRGHGRDFTTTMKNACLLLGKRKTRARERC